MVGVTLYNLEIRNLQFCRYRPPPSPFIPEPILVFVESSDHFLYFQEARGTEDVSIDCKNVFIETYVYKQAERDISHHTLYELTIPHSKSTTYAFLDMSLRTLL